MTTIDNSQDVMDSRDIIERLEELQGEREVLAGELAAAEECVKYHHPDGVDFAEDAQPTEVMEFRRCRDELAKWEEDNAEELAALEAFCSQLEGYGDWAHGDSVIRESYFTAYIEELIDDCYPDAAKSANSGEWPYRHMSMDFEAAADEAKADYTEAEFNGVTYLMRA